MRYRDRSQVLLLLENLTPYQGSDVGRVLSMRLFSIISSLLDRSCINTGDRKELGKLLQSLAAGDQVLVAGVILALEVVF